jgi:flagellar basal-body rod protein FlgF
MPAIQSLVQSMQAQWQRHEVLANNLANVSTPGFKRDDLALVPTFAVPASGANVLSLPSGESLIQWTDFAQASLQPTSRPLDAAINGRGFFVVDTPNGPRYTRAGAFNVGQGGALVTPGGAQVLGQRGPIVVTAGRVTISSNGEVQVNGQVIDTLRVVDFPRPYQLLKEGGNLFAPADPSVTPTPATGFDIAGGALEQSNVSVVETMVSMIAVLRTYEAAQRAMQSVEETNRQATSDIGKVS